MIAGWLAGKVSGIIIFLVACLAVVLLPMLIIQTIRIDGLDLGGWYAVKGYKALYESSASDLRTAHANTAALGHGLDTCNASIDNTAKMGKILAAATAAMIAQLDKTNAALQGNITALKAIKSTNEKCPTADAILTRGFQ